MGGENRHGKPQSEKATLVDVDVNVNLGHGPLLLATKAQKSFNLAISDKKSEIIKKLMFNGYYLMKMSS